MQRGRERKTESGPWSPVIQMPASFQVCLDGHWTDYASNEDRLLKQALMAGRTHVKFRHFGYSYFCDLKKLTQVNLESGKMRKIRSPCFQVNIDGHWQDYASDEDIALRSAFLAGSSHHRRRCRGHVYAYDFGKMVQTNVASGMMRTIRAPPGLRASIRSLASSCPSTAADRNKSSQRQGLKVTEFGQKKKKVVRGTDGSSVVIRTGKLGRRVSDARTGRLVESKKVTKKTKLELKRGRIVETETIVIKRVRTR